MQFFDKRQSNAMDAKDAVDAVAASKSKVIPFAASRSELLSRGEAAAYLGVKTQTLNVWSCTRRYNLPFVKIGRLVKYKKSDLDKFIESRTIGLVSNE